MGGSGARRYNHSGGGGFSININFGFLGNFFSWAWSGISGFGSNFWGAITQNNTGTGITEMWIPGDMNLWGLFGWGIEGGGVILDGDGNITYGPNLYNQPIMDNWYNLLESLASCLSVEAYTYFDNNPHLIPSLIAYNAEHGCDALGSQDIVQIIENQTMTGDGSDFECRANYYQFIQKYNLEGAVTAPELFEMIGWQCPCGEFNEALEECAIAAMFGITKQQAQQVIDEGLLEELYKLKTLLGLSVPEIQFLTGNTALISETNNFVTTCTVDPNCDELMGNQFADVLLTIKIASNSDFTNSEYNNMLEGFNDYSTSNDVDAFVDAFFDNGINPLATNTSDAIITNSNPNSPITLITPSEDMDRDKIWEHAGPIKQNLLNAYPALTTKINNLFTCAVLGKAFEEVALGSLGVPKNTQNFGGSIPDGNYFMTAYEIGGTTHSQPNFIEIKCHLANGDFDYSSNPSQLENYLNYIESNTYKGSTTIGSHSLHLVVPSGVSIGQNIINDCNSKNIPLFVSFTELGDNDLNNFRVIPFDIVNISNLNRSDHYFADFPDAFWESSVRGNRKTFHLNFDYSAFDIQKHADAFETSYLIGNEDGCPPD